MGKWKYINWLMVLIILAHMYYYISNRYQGAPLAYWLSTAGWLFVAALGYYVFVHRIQNNGGDSGRKVPHKELPKSPLKERPKVTFKKKDEH